MTHVWIVEDGKYGVQAAAATERIAEAILARDWPHISGEGACIIKMRLRETLEDINGRYR